MVQSIPPSDPNFSGDSGSPGRVECEYDTDTPPSIAIVQAIAAMENVDPVDSPSELGITLHDHVDPAALDDLATRDDESSVTIDLTIHNDHRYFVRVRNTGQVVVERSD